MKLFRLVAQFACAITIASTVHTGEAKADGLAKWLDENAVETSSASTADKDFNWFDGTMLTLEGKAFDDTKTSYSRLPMRSKDLVTPSVWGNAECATGVAIRFVSDSTTISASWDNRAPMVHMAYTGSGGLDLYAREDGKWKFCGVGFPKSNQTTSSNSLMRLAPKGDLPVEYLLFLPLYSPVTKLEIGIPKDCRIAPAPPEVAETKPIVFYGTSITMGGCASRAGMCHAAILRRWLDVPVINLGFSGAGKSEMAMSDILAEIPAQLYILEPVSNMSPQMIDERTVSFVENLRKKRPDTPILMVDGPNEGQTEANNHWHKAYNDLISKGIKDLTLLRAEDIFHSRENPTVDNSHPTDLGFYEMALSYEPVIRKLINMPENSQNARPGNQVTPTSKE